MVRAEMLEARGEVGKSSERVTPCGGGFEYLDRNPASSRRRRKGNPVPRSITGPPCYGGIKIQGPGPPGWWSLEPETVKYDHEGHESRGNGTRE
jgi:hypothetical protein